MLLVETRFEVLAQAFDAFAIGAAVAVADPGSGAKMQLAGLVIDANFEIVDKANHRCGELGGKVGAFHLRDPAPPRFDGLGCNLQDAG